jgi:hypothetical protein
VLTNVPRARVRAQIGGFVTVRLHSVVSRAGGGRCLRSPVRVCARVRGGCRVTPCDLTLECVK